MSQILCAEKTRFRAEMLRVYQILNQSIVWLMIFMVRSGSGRDTPINMGRMWGRYYNEFSNGDK